MARLEATAAAAEPRNHQHAKTDEAGRGQNALD